MRFIVLESSWRRGRWLKTTDPHTKWRGGVDYFLPCDKHTGKTLHRMWICICWTSPALVGIPRNFPRTRRNARCRKLIRFAAALRPGPAPQTP